MKTLVKLAAVAALFLFTTAASAQIKIGANAGVVLPTGDFGDVAKTGFGGGLSGAYMLNDNMSVGLGLGYSSFTSKLSSSITMSIVPVTANYTYYFGTEGLKPYVGLDLGYYMMKAEGGGVSTSETDFGYAPTVGVQYPLSDALALDANVKYNYIASSGTATTSLGINVGVVYSLGK